MQCSNCGSTWFQEDSDAGLTEPQADDDAQVQAGDTLPAEDAPEPDQVDEVTEESGEDEDYMSDDDDDDDDEEPEAEPSDKPIPQSTVSKQSATILREEAMRELKARLAEGPSLESQGDLGIDVGNSDRQPRPVSKEPTPVSVPQPRGATGVSRDLETSEAVADSVSPNRDRLPDIEEINSTLTASAARVGAMDISAGSGRSVRRTGFRVGFISIVIASVAALVIYVYSPRIASARPETAPALGAYVSSVDDVRRSFNLWTERTMKSITDTIDGALSDG